MSWFIRKERLLDWMDDLGDAGILEILYQRISQMDRKMVVETLL